MRSRISAFFLAALLITGEAFGAGPDWQDEFSRLCGDLGGAETLSLAQLEGRAAACERLTATIRAEGRKENKIYLLRLERCRRFYEYLTEVKQAE